MGLPGLCNIHAESWTYLIYLIIYLELAGANLFERWLAPSTEDFGILPGHAAPRQHIQENYSPAIYAMCTGVL